MGRPTLAILALGAALGMCGCGEETVGPEPPFIMGSLTVTRTTAGSIELSWTAPGIGSDGRRATAYDIRYAPFEIDEANWDHGAVWHVGGEPPPSFPGTAEQFVVSGLTPGILYWLAIKATDEESNWSTLSNVVSARTAWVSLEMVPVPSGSFRMGDGGRNDCGYDERDVSLTHAFRMGAHEVTNNEFITALQWAYENNYVVVSFGAVLDLLDAGGAPLLKLDQYGCEIAFADGYFRLVDAGHGRSNGNHPVKQVTWYGAASFCDWVSMMEYLPRAYDHSTWKCNGGNPYGARGYRLPTDAEWEYAARFEDGRIYPWGNQSPACGRANYCESWTTPWGTFLDGPVIQGRRLQDMAGNVSEWCNDWLECRVGTLSSTNPAGPSSGQMRVIRGVGFGSPGEEHRTRCAWRYGRAPGLTSPQQGFRCVRTQ